MPYDEEERARREQRAAYLEIRDGDPNNLARTIRKGSLDRWLRRQQLVISLLEEERWNTVRGQLLEQERRLEQEISTLGTTDGDNGGLRK